MVIISKNWDNFFASILLSTCLPLLPILIEVLVRGSVSLKNLLLATAMYIILLVIGAYSMVQFAPGLIVSLSAAIAYGFIEQPKPSYEIRFMNFCIISIVIIVLIHIIERYFLHVKEEKPFFNFAGMGK